MYASIEDLIIVYSKIVALCQTYLGNVSGSLQNYARIEILIIILYTKCLVNNFQPSTRNMLE